MLAHEATGPDPRRVYEERRAVRQAAHAVTERRHQAVGTFRLIVLGVAGALGIGIVGGAGYSGWWLLAALAGVFGLGVWLDRIEAERARLERAIAYYDRGLSRLDDAWAGTGARGDEFADPKHLYAADLDLFGDGSVFQRLCAARTRRGMGMLAAWLLAPAAPGVVRERQTGVDELTPNLDLREDLAVLGDDTRAAVDAQGLATWGAAPPASFSPALLAAGRIASAAGALALAAGVAYTLAGLRSLELSDSVRSLLGWYFVVAVLGVAIVQSRLRPTAERIFEAVEGAAHDTALLGALLARLEAERFHAPRLAELHARLDADGDPASRRVARLTRLKEQVDSRHNTMARLFGFFLVWDVHLAHAVERWRLASGPGLGAWLDAVGELEALSSLAGYRFERPADIWPEFVDGAPQFEAEALTHPLLRAEAVPNDVRLGSRLQVLILSGSNMSGKSTLLRAIGINAILAQAGAPVRARRLRMSPLTVGASIRIVDSLQDGSSRFHAEILRLQAILAKARGDERDGDGTPDDARPVLFLIDECLHGTNSHDRRIGADAVVGSLAERGAIGIVTTHDLALTAIADTLGSRAGNMHFTDQLTNGKLRFDYRLRPGVVGKGNAIELMRSAGFEIPPDTRS